MQRVSLVTGASSGIGEVIARMLAQRGDHVVVSSHRLERCSAVADAIGAAGGHATALSADLLDPDQISKLIHDIVERFGRLDHVVASGAGFSPEGLKFKLFAEMDPTEFPGVVAAHWLSKAYLAHSAIPVMREQGYGKIVSISSDAGRTATPNEAMLGGAAAGLMMMSRVLAREVGRYGVRVNVVALGPLDDVDMDRVAQLAGDGEANARVASGLKRRMLFPVTMTDVAESVGFLLAPTGDNITGQVISVNGGVSTP